MAVGEHSFTIVVVGSVENSFGLDDSMLRSPYDIEVSKEAARPTFGFDFPTCQEQLGSWHS